MFYPSPNAKHDIAGLLSCQQRCPTAWQSSCPAFCSPKTYTPPHRLLCQYWSAKAAAMLSRSPMQAAQQVLKQHVHAPARHVYERTADQSWTSLPVLLPAIHLSSHGHGPLVGHHARRLSWPMSRLLPLCCGKPRQPGSDSDVCNCHMPHVLQPAATMTRTNSSFLPQCMPSVSNGVHCHSQQMC